MRTWMVPFVMSVAMVLAGVHYAQASETVVYSESFDSDNGGYVSQGYPMWEWGTPTVYGPSAPHSGTGIWGSDLNGLPPSGMTGDLVSPGITVPALSSGEFARVRFYAYTDINMTGRGRFYASSDGISWDQIAVLYMNETDGWKKYEFDLSAYAGGTTYLKFSLYTGGGGKPGFYLDDVNITMFEAGANEVVLTLEANEASDGSCPWVFPWDGTDYAQDNDIYSVARYDFGEYRDYYRLEKDLVPENGVYRLEVREIEHEDSWTDLVGLVAVDHEDNVEIGVDDSGNIYAYRPLDLIAPVTAVDGDGTDVRDQIYSIDDTGYHAYSEQILDLDFGDVDLSNGAKLVLRIKGFQTGDGEEMPFIGPPAVVVQVRNGAGTWVEAGRIKPRFQWSHGVFDLSGLLPDSSGNNRVRLYSISHGEKFHEIDFAALAAGPEPVMDVTELPLTTAEFEGQDALGTLNTADNDYILMTTGQKFGITFSTVEQTLPVRDFIFVSEGYYIPRNTFYIHTWDGSQWVLRDGYSYPTGDATRTFDLSLFLPDSDGEYKVRVWQNYTSSYAAYIDYIDLAVNGTDGALATALDIQNGGIDISAAVSASDDVRFKLGTSGRTRWSEYSWTGLPVNTPPSSPPGSPPEVTGNSISWTYSDPEGEPQVAAEVEMWTGEQGTGDNLWDPEVFYTTETSVDYEGDPLESGVGYFARVKLSDGTSWGSWQDIPFVANLAPSISGTPAASVYTGNLYTFSPTANDSEGDPLSFTIANPPAWAVFDAGTGTLSGTPLPVNGGTDAGIVISVTDGASTVSLASFDIEIILDIDGDGDGVVNTKDAFPLDPAEWLDTDSDGTGNNADTDDDGDGTLDTLDAFPLDAAEWVDTDGDGIGNNADTDDDNDGVVDGSDAFPLDAAEWVDTDSDGTGNNADTDDDNDGVLDTADALPLDAAESVDTDSDGIGNNADTDDDGDGVADTSDAFPLDSAEWVDTDSDGIGNNADTDDDGDGVADTSDAFPLDSTEWVDTDSDGTGNNADTDDDNDGVADISDAFPLDAAEWVDTDSDGTGNNADTDDDGDGVADGSDAFPLDASETVDTDSDGIGNNADTDDDGDGVADGSDAFPLDATETVDTDSDGIGNNADTDDDDDGVADISDAFPLDAAEWVDTDGDGIGDNADTDDDNDGVLDTADALPLDAAESVDTDSDGIGNNADTDDDGDGVVDGSDAFPLDSAEWVDTDSDGIGNNADTDDDGDGVADTSDAFPLDPAEWVDTDSDGTGNNADTDDDGDGVLDTTDAFPLDSAEWVDTDSDGIGNNADTDDDNDGVLDTTDAFPLDAGETVDTDSDGTGNNADTDDDGDGVLDVSDAFPLNGSETVDTDSDGVGNNADADDDNDGVTDVSDAFPLDPTEWVDTDSDGVGNNADADDDNDGVTDTQDAFPLNATESVDTDGDGTGNNGDTDDDNDGVLDVSDAFPLDSSEWLDTDSDGIGNNADTDDDGDGVADDSDAFPLDAAEWVDTDSDGVGNNADTDDDGDGVADNSDAFPLDSSESVDTDGDGIGDNADTFPSDPAETMDSDNDGVGDNEDAFPEDADETVDTDSDGVGDNADEFPTDPGETVDADSDGVGDNSDAFPLDDGETVDTDSDGTGNNADTDDDDDGVLDENDLFPLVDTPVGLSDDPYDDGLTGVRRSDGGDDSGNLIEGAPSLDIEYTFDVVVRKGPSEMPSAVQVIINGQPYDMTFVEGDPEFVARFEYTTRLGPSPANSFNFQTLDEIGALLERFPASGDLEGPSVYLLRGTNLISVPKSLNETIVIEDLLGTSIVGQWESLGVTTTENDGHYNFLVDSASGAGYFMQRTGDEPLPDMSSIPDVASSIYTVDLEPGWNLIGNPYIGNVAVTDILLSRNGEEAISWLDAAQQYWILNALYSYGGDDWGASYVMASPGVDPDTYLVPWIGYWAYVFWDDAQYSLIIPRP